MTISDQPELASALHREETAAWDRARGGLDGLTWEERRMIEAAVREELAAVRDLVRSLVAEELARRPHADGAGGVSEGT